MWIWSLNSPIKLQLFQFLRINANLCLHLHNIKHFNISTFLNLKGLKYKVEQYLLLNPLFPLLQLSSQIFIFNKNSLQLYSPLHVTKSFHHFNFHTSAFYFNKQWLITHFVPLRNAKMNKLRKLSSNTQSLRRETDAKMAHNDIMWWAVIEIYAKQYMNTDGVEWLSQGHIVDMQLRKELNSWLLAQIWNVFYCTKATFLYQISSPSSNFLSIIEKLWFIKLLICSFVPVPPLMLITNFTFQFKPLSPSVHSWSFLSFKCNKIHQLHPTRK